MASPYGSLPSAIGEYVELAEARAESNGLEITGPLLIGVCRPGETRSLDIEIRAIGELPVTVSAAASSSARFSVGTLPGEIAPGTSESITITFDPGTEDGVHDGTLTLTANTEIGALEIPVRGITYESAVPIEEVSDFGLVTLAHRRVEEDGEKWMEVGFRIDVELVGDAENGWTGPDGFLRFEIERSENLVNWFTGDLIDCAETAIPNGDGTWDYWARCKFPIDSAIKHGQIRASSGMGGLAEYGNISPDARNNPITGITINSVLQSLARYPYTMPTDAAELQTDLRALGWTGATVTATSATVWEIIVPGVAHTDYTITNKVSWPGYLVPDMYGNLTITLDSIWFAGEYYNEEEVRTAIRKQFFRLTPYAAERVPVGTLAAGMAAEVDALLADEEPAVSRAIFNITPWWVPEVYEPNPYFFAPEIRRQITGVSMRSGGWDQGYGPQMVTPRHAIFCGHNGPDPGVPVWFVKEDGSEIFQTSILKRINDYPGKFSSDAKQTSEADLSIVLLADAVPGWVYKAPVLALSQTNHSALTAAVAPTLAISQGNSTPEVFPNDPGSWTPSGRMLYVSAADPLATFSTLREPFARRPKVTGDSGTPEFILWQGQLSLYRVINYSSGQGALVSLHIPYIQRLIARADASAGISTGYRLQVLNFQFT